MVCALDSLTIQPEHVQADMDEGSRQCAEDLARVDVHAAEIQRVHDTVKAMANERFTEYERLNSEIESVERSRKELRNWLETFESRVMTEMSMDSKLIDHTTESVKNLVKAHTEKTDLQELRARRARALGAVQHLMKIANLDPIASMSTQCCLCMERTIERAVVPCGHVFCNTCYSRAPNARICFTCRTPVTTTVRLYF